jgi:ribonuclease P protein component
VPGDPSQPTRVGVAVGAGVGNAVRRNRAKRLLREAARGASIKRGTDLVLIAKPRLVDSSFTNARASVREAIERAGSAC